MPGFLASGVTPGDLVRQALDELPTHAYPQEECAYVHRDADAVAEFTRTALGMIPSDVRILAQERRLYRQLGRSSLQIGAQVDLVLRNRDGQIEHIDFKTGKRNDNTVQELISRAVVSSAYPIHRDILSTTLYLATRQRDSVILDRETSRRDWERIAQDIRDIRNLDRFPAVKSGLCEYCPFRERECSVW